MSPIRDRWMRAGWSVLALAVAQLCPQVVFGQSSVAGEWLIGTWEGALVDYQDKSGPNRSLKILSIAPSGAAQGTWFITGQDEYLVKIKVEDGQRLKIISASNVAIELARQGENQLVGSFTPTNGRTYQIALAKVSGPPEPNVASLAKELVGKWEGEISSRARGNDPPGRTLYIDSVSLKEGQWLVRGRYGITGKGVGRVNIEVLEAGKSPSFKFLTGANSTVILRRVGEKGLDGSIKYLGGNWGNAPDPMRLERVD